RDHYHNQRDGILERVAVACVLSCRGDPCGRPMEGGDGTSPDFIRATIRSDIYPNQGDGVLGLSLVVPDYLARGSPGLRAGGACAASPPQQAVPSQAPAVHWSLQVVGLPSSQIVPS